MNLKLNRSLVFFDLETTGVNVASDRIVEIALLKVNPEGKQELLTKRINPTVPIPAEASAVHHIFDEDVRNEKTFKEVAKSIQLFIGNSDLAGYNSNRFDVPLLVEEFLRADVDFDMEKRKLIDVQNIFHKMEQRTLGAAYKFYCDKELLDAHQAEADTVATFEILQAQLSRYSNLENDAEFLHNFSSRSNAADLVGRIIYDEHGKEVFNFGKHKGKLVEDVLRNEPSYYSWMMNNDFPLYTKKVLTRIKLNTFQQ
jgi:DNA polymerase-3 subunit epsilon